MTVLLTADTKTCTTDNPNSTATQNKRMTTHLTQTTNITVLTNTTVMPQTKYRLIKTKSLPLIPFIKKSLHCHTMTKRYWRTTRYNWQQACACFSISEKWELISAICTRHIRHNDVKKADFAKLSTFKTCFHCVKDSETKPTKYISAPSSVLHVTTC